MTDPVAYKSPDLAGISRKIERFIANYVAANSANGLVIGLSGGLDSSVVLKLAVNAIGAKRVHGLVMPSKATPDRDIGDAVGLAKELGIQYDVIKIDSIVASFMTVLPDNERAMGNLSARMRMCLLYYHAAMKGYLVAGTSDKSEMQIGYFTKYGDGAADILPIAALYKTQVRDLASFLQIPNAITVKKSSPRLWKDHLAEEEIGISYDKLDPILEMLVDRKKAPKEVAKKLGVSLSDINKVMDMVAKTAHKRQPVAFAKL
jgi:NAD+ synthase